MRIMRITIHFSPLRLYLDDKEENLLIARGPIDSFKAILWLKNLNKMFSLIMF